MKSENEKRAWVDVYVSPLPDTEVKAPILPRERELEIESVSSERIRKEKYHAWRLLEYALRESLGLSLPEAGLYKHISGKWRSPRAELSISHSGGAVAVAVSHYPVGVDIERADRVLDPGFARRMLTAGERDALGECGCECVLLVWCKKEALFKSLCESRFIPRVTETLDAPIWSDRVTVGGVPYYLAVASREGADVRIIPCEGVL